MAELTPMMKQYYQIKAEVPEAILFFRLGDFYEMFESDALIACEILGITLTARSKGENKIPMCGIPYHSAAGYIAKLTRAGKKVAICEQVSDPTLPGIVKREVVRIISPGTTLDENVLEQKTANYLAAIVAKEIGWSIAWADLSTGEFNLSEVENQEELVSCLEKYRPAEVLFEENLREIVVGMKKHFPKIFWQEEKNMVVGDGDLTAELSDQFGGETSQKLNFSSQKASAMIVNFLKNTQKNGLNHMRELKIISTDDLMALDESTIKNLEILENAREKKTEGSLLGVLDRTVTAGGGRLLKRLLVQPMQSLDRIEQRLDKLEFFLKNQNLLLDLRESLKQVMDIERMLSRLSLASGNARDLRGIVNTFKAFAAIKNLLNLQSNAGIMAKLVARIDLLENLIETLDKALLADPAFSTRDGGMIAEGFQVELDEYKALSRDGKGFIQAMQTREIARTGINSLKVKYNKIFGYYIEISNANLAQAPSDYTRKQTLANAERFSTPELKEYEEKVLSAEEKICELEEMIFEQLKNSILTEISSIKRTAETIAYLDVLSNFALVSWENSYVRPIMNNGYDLELKDGRHAVIEKLNPQDKFIPNDTKLVEGEYLALITGPNMGGKSTFLRQTALIVLMAHLGMYVPCSSAKIPLVDRIFTRVGASDNLVRGQSTFWVEMEETAMILRNATQKSLIVLDEIGRGTSTFDGVSIAWGIMEYIHNEVGAKTLFASHYHELIGLADQLDKAGNWSVKVEENDSDGVIFLYKIVNGGVDRSYGIEVARLAGLPGEVVNRAKEILVDLEREQIGGKSENVQLIEGDRKHAGLGDEYINRLQNLAEGVRKVDLNNLTPIDAINKLSEFKKLI